MAQLPVNLPFEQWLDYLFGAPVGPSGFRESDDWWDEQADPPLAVANLTRLFEESALLAERYPHDQLDRGLWFLAGESGHLRPLFEVAVPWPARRRGLLAISNLYAELFAHACSNFLGHLDRGPDRPRPLNSSCYMWWDLFPTWGGGNTVPASPTVSARIGVRPSARHRTRLRGALDTYDEREFATVDDVILHVMERTLRLESEPCREGALHGLGHWHSAHPGRTETIIDVWLFEGPTISPELRTYAGYARSGCIQ